MKKQSLIIAALCGLAVLSGCHNRGEQQSLSAQTQAVELKAMPQSYRGILPCADCSGIEMTLFLVKDGSWVMNQRYLNEKTPLVIASYGTWARTAGKLVLTGIEGQKYYFRPVGDNLQMLDQQGKAIDSSLNYTLKATRDPLSTTPMAMRGTYLSETNAAMFTDCVTGRQTGIANEAQLNHRGGAQQALVVLKGHFMLQPGSDTGAPVKLLVVDEVEKYSPNKDCGDF